MEKKELSEYMSDLFTIIEAVGIAMLISWLFFDFEVKLTCLCILIYIRTAFINNTNNELSNKIDTLEEEIENLKNK